MRDILAVSSWSVFNPSVYNRSVFNRLFCHLIVVLAVLCIVCGMGGAAHAQFSTTAKPDVLIVVMPAANGQYGVTTVYPRLIPHAASNGYIKRLLAVSGWKANGLTFEDGRYNEAERRHRGDNVKAAADPATSSATFYTSGALVDWRNGSFDIEPFARAYRDLSHIYIVYQVPGLVFHGLRQHSDSNIDVTMQGQNGAYTYLLTVKNHRIESLGLPRYEITRPGSVIRSAATRKRSADLSGTNRAVGTGLVVLLAAATGIAVYLLMNRTSKP